MNWNWKTSSLWQRLLAALLIVAAASAFRVVFFANLGRGIPYLLYFPSVTLAALYGGLPAGLLATALSAALSCFWVQQGNLSPVESLALAIFAASGMLISFICGAMHRGHQQAKQAEAAQRETKEYLENLFNHANAPIIVWDADGKIARFNPAFEEIAGVKAEQVVGQGLDFLFAEDQRERAMGIVRRAGAGERFDLVEVPIRRANGAQRTVLWNLAPVFGAETKTQIATIAQGQDITERNRAEDALRQSERRLRCIYESNMIGLFFWNMQGQILEANSKFLDMVGYTREELQGGRIDWVNMTPPEFRHLDERSVAELKAIGFNRSPFEKEYIRKDRTRMPITIAGAMLDETRESGVAFVLDITARKRVEAALRESEERFRLAAQTANDLVYEWDLQQNLQWFGKVDEMLGYEPGEFPRTLDGWVAAVHPEDQKRVSVAIQAHLEAHAPYAEDYRVRQRDGAYRWWSAGGAAARTPEGKPVRWVGSVTDITARKRAEEALNASEARYRRLHESTMDSICCVDMAGVLQDFNPAYQALVGYSENEIHRLTYSDLTPEKWHAEETRIVSEQVLPRGYSDVYEKEYRRKNGTIVPIELRTILLRDADNRPAGMWAIIRDISARKQAEEALRHQQELLIETGRIAQVGGWEFEPATGQGTWTEEVARIHDLDPADETNMALGLSFYTGESRVRIEAAIQEAVMSARSYDLVLELTTAKRNHKWVRTIGHPLVQNGTVVRLHGSYQDITQLKRAEEALRRTQHLLTETERMGKVGGWEFDVDSGQQVWTEEIYRIHELDFTYDPTVAKGINFYAPASRSVIERAVQRAIVHGEPFDLELQIVTAKGNLRDVHAIGKADPARRKVFGFFQDITERKRAEDEVRRLNADLEQRVRDRTAELEVTNKELEAFSYSVSHDLRTPLRAMDGFSMALLEDYAGQLDETAQNYLRRIRAGSQRMAGLIDDLLNLSKLTRETVHREPVDLTAIAGEIGADLRRMNPERGVEWCVAPALTADADKGMVRAVLNNLLGNAWKFTGRRADARIEFGTTAHNGEPAFFVRDNGAGFDMAYAGRLFGAFQRLHSIQEFAGNGIGLALVQRIVRRHGGRVWADGAVGQGATFYFTLGKERD